MQGTQAAPDALAALAEAFVARTLPKSAWTHEAHLRVGFWHVLRHGPDEALALLRDRIRALNESHGVANSDTGGYHETITRFYVLAIARFLRETTEHGEGEGRRDGRAGHEDALADRLLAELGARDLPLRHWSKARLMAVEARRDWVEPDLRPLVG